MSMSLTGATGRGNSLKGTGYQSAQLQQFSPEQMQLFQSLFSGLGPNSQLSKLASGDQSAFEQLEAPALKQFQGLQSQIGSQFSGQGLGGRHGSGFQNTSNQATSDFAQQLQSQRMGLQRQAMQDLHGMAGSLLQQRPFENFVMPEKKPFWQELLTAGAGGIGQGLGGAAFGAAQQIPWAKLFNRDNNGANTT